MQRGRPKHALSLMDRLKNEKKAVVLVGQETVIEEGTVHVPFRRLMMVNINAWSVVM
jgi:hypothetical protein